MQYQEATVYLPPHTNQVDGWYEWNRPWVLLIPGNFDYPAEKENIEQAYTYFSDWAKSTGTTRKDWYGSLVGYRNVSKIYKKNP